MLLLGAAKVARQKFEWADVDCELIYPGVYPQYLGIKTAGGMKTDIITRNTHLPCRKSKIFTTVKDDQSSVKIQVYEGVRCLAQNNFPIVTFWLTDIPSAPKGDPQIEVIFQLDGYDELTVTARNKDGGRPVTVRTVINSSRLSREEVEEMMFEAQNDACVAASDIFDSDDLVLREQTGDHENRIHDEL